MKRFLTLIYCFVALGALVLAAEQRLAVKFHSGHAWIPNGWPQEVVAVADANTLPAGYATNMGSSALAQYVADRQASYDAAESAHVFLETAPGDIKAEADRRVAVLTGDIDSKVNKVAAMVSLLDLRLAAIETQLGLSLTNSLTTNQVATTQALRAMWAQVAAIRAYEAGLKARAATGEVFTITSQQWP